jgi:hypothetical protein
MLYALMPGSLPFPHTAINANRCPIHSKYRQFYIALKRWDPGRLLELGPTSPTTLSAPALMDFLVIVIGWCGFLRVMICLPDRPASVGKGTLSLYDWSGEAFPLSVSLQHTIDCLPTLDTHHMLAYCQFRIPQQWETPAPCCCASTSTSKRLSMRQAKRFSPDCIRFTQLLRDGIKLAEFSRVFFKALMLHSQLLSEIYQFSAMLLILSRTTATRA